MYTAVMEMARQHNGMVALLEGANRRPLQRFRERRRHGAPGGPFQTMPFPCDVRAGSARCLNPHFRFER